MGEQEHKSTRMPNGILSTNFNILNKGNEPIFIISDRKEVTQLTLVTNKTADMVNIWHVSDEISLSDHRNKVFQVGDLGVTKPTYCNPKTTNWESYWKGLKAKLGNVPRVIH